MIKRDNVELMNARTKNVKIAKETLAILKKGEYTSPNGKVISLTNSMEASLKGTILYKEFLPSTLSPAIVPTIEVVNETTAQSAARLLRSGKTNLVALNFASARNQGGGFLAGALAQEEDLCRCSGLYPCLKSKPVFYNENILCDHSFYTENLIYSPKVPFFRNEYHLLMEQPFDLSIISSPAPNVSAMKKPSPEQEEEFEEVLYGTLLFRARNILRVAEKHGHRNIILGAWGCGAFGNNAEQVSVIFQEALKEIPAFEHVCFAVYDTRQPPVLFEAFRETFNDNISR